jgi:hypothetical protein
LITLIGFDPLGPGAKTSVVKTAEIALIALIGFDPAGPAAKPPANKTDKITLIGRIPVIRLNHAHRPIIISAFQPLGRLWALSLSKRLSAFQVLPLTLITLIGFDPVGPAAERWPGKTDEITLIWFDWVECTARTRHFLNVAAALTAKRPEPQFRSTPVNLAWSGRRQASISECPFGGLRALSLSKRLRSSIPLRLPPIFGAFRFQ